VTLKKSIGMRYQGKLVEWDDDKGFGFVLPNAGGRKIFVHFNEFASRKRHPEVGDLLTFEVGLDANKRSCAVKIAPVIAPLERAQAASQREGREDASKFSHWLAFAWLTYLLVLVALNKLPWKFVVAWIALNALTYMVYAADKSSAKRGRWRTPEARLHLLALAGGWPAAAIAQQRLRHKSSKGEFRAMFWLTVIVNCAGMIWVATNGRELLAVFA
jgi:uncharacterized membrane protein YsdA (DUF1294 family)/cold shock CspA family protein